MEMVDNIQFAFLDILHKITWMDEKTRIAAINKAKSLTVHIGYPDELLDNKILEEYYSDLDVNEENYFENVIKLAQYKLDLAYNKLRKPINKTAWEQRSMPGVANAFYSPVENSIRKSKRVLLSGKPF